MDSKSQVDTPRAVEIEFRNVSLSFDEKPVLIDVNFKLESREMIFITGLSGSGKSVLLHLAMGLLKPDEGQIFISEREIEGLDESELLAIRGGLMGMVFQEDSLFSGLSVYDNVAYRLEEHGWAEKDIERAVREVLQFVGLEGEEEKVPEELSGGMKRRVEIARALIGWPSIMLFDEPTLSLDPIVAHQILDLIIRARDVNNISSLYVTKKMDELPYLATNRAISDEQGTAFVVRRAQSRGEMPKSKVIVLDAGRIAFTGSVEEFQNSSLPTIKQLRDADNGTRLSDFYIADPWDKSRKPKEEIL